MTLEHQPDPDKNKAKEEVKQEDAVIKPDKIQKDLHDRSGPLWIRVDAAENLLRATGSR